MSTGETPQHGRVALIDNHVLFTDSLALALSRESYDVRTIPVPESPNAADELVAATLRLEPAVVLLEINLGRFGNGSRIIEPITSAGPAIVVVTASNDTTRWGEAIEAGAATVLSKDAKLGEPLRSAGSSTGNRFSPHASGTTGWERGRPSETS